MALIAQVWVWPGVSEWQSWTANDVTIRMVRMNHPSTGVVDALLLESNTDNNDFDDGPSSEKAFRRIGQMLTRLSFATLVKFHIVTAHLVKSDLKVGDKTECTFFPGAPPGIALFELSVGFATQHSFETDLLERPISADIEIAMTWFNFGNEAMNSIQKVFAYWIGIETLAGTKRSQKFWTCEKCHMQTRECPHCGASTEFPLATETIRNYLRSLGVSSTEIDKLYKFRNDIGHGRLAMNPSGISKASNEVLRLQTLLLKGLKQAVGVSFDAPPNIVPEGFTIMGVPGLFMTDIVVDANFYDSPSELPSTNSPTEKSR